MGIATMIKEQLLNDLAGQRGDSLRQFICQGLSLLVRPLSECSRLARP